MASNEQTKICHLILMLCRTEEAFLLPTQQPPPRFSLNCLVLRLNPSRAWQRISQMQIALMTRAKYYKKALPPLRTFITTRMRTYGSTCPPGFRLCWWPTWSGGAWECRPCQPRRPDLLPPSRAASSRRRSIPLIPMTPSLRFAETKKNKEYVLDRELRFSREEENLLETQSE